MVNYAGAFSQSESEKNFEWIIIIIIIIIIDNFYSFFVNSTASNRDLVYLRRGAIHENYLSLHSPNLFDS